MQAALGRQKMFPGVPSVDRGNLGRERDIARSECALYVLLIYKYVDRFRKGSLYGLYCLKASQVSKVHARNVPVS